MSEDINPELIEKATSAVRHERAYIAAAFGDPLDSVGECAGIIARAVLSAVADDLRAEGDAKALREAADAQDADPEFRDLLRLKTDWLRSRADRIEHDGRCPHQKCPGGSLCCCLFEAHDE